MNKKDILQNTGFVNSGFITPPPIPEKKPVEMDPVNPSIPVAFPEGVGAKKLKDFKAASKISKQQIFRDQVDQSAFNSLLEWLRDLPAAFDEWRDTGNAELDNHKEELTQGVPVDYWHDIMSSWTLAGARAKRDRIINDERVISDLANQTGITPAAIKMGASLFDLDAPLMFLPGGTIYGAKTLASTAKATKALTGSARLPRVAGGIAVGASGGALAGGLTGGVEAAVRPDVSVNDFYNRILAGASVGGAFNTAGEVLFPDTALWAKAAEAEKNKALADLDIAMQTAFNNPESDFNTHTSPLGTTDLADIPVPPVFGENSIGAAQAPDRELVKEITTDQLGLKAPPRVKEWSAHAQGVNQSNMVDEQIQRNITNKFVKTIVGFNKDNLFVETVGRILTAAQRDYTKLVSAPSPTAKFMATNLLESASGLTRNGASAAVLMEMFKKSALTRGIPSLRKFRAQYFKDHKLNPFLRSSQKKFDRDLRLQMQRRYDGQDVDPYYKDVIDDLDEMHAEALTRMQADGEERAVTGSREVEHRPGYFRHDWNAQKLLEAKEAGATTKALVKAFKIAAIRSGISDDKIASKVARATVRRLENKQKQLSHVDRRRLDLDTRSDIANILEEGGVPEEEIKEIMNRLDRQEADRSTKSYLKHRINFDPSTPIEGTNLQLVDLMSEGIERSFQRYVADSAGAAALAHKGLRDQSEINTMIDALMIEQDHLRTPKDQRFAREEIEAIINQFSGNTHQGYMLGRAENGINPLMATLNRLTRASFLQNAGLVQMMDCANTVVANGLSRSMEPLLARIGWGEGMSKAELVKLREELENIGVIVAKDHNLFDRFISIEEQTSFDSIILGAQQLSGRLERLTNFASGQFHVTSFQQLVSAAATTSNIIRHLAGEETNLTRRKLYDIGLTEPVLTDLDNMIHSGVIKVEGGRVTLNSSKWDYDTALEFGAAIERAVGQQVQKHLIGETSVWMNTNVGNLFTTLKSFGMVAGQKQLARNLMLGGMPQVAQAAAWQLGFAYAMVTLIQMIRGNDMSPIDRARLALVYTPTAGSLTALVDPITTMLGFDDLNFSPYGRYATFGSIPMASALERLQMAPGAIIKNLLGKDDYNDDRNAKAMFFMNLYFMSRLWDAM